MNNLFQSPLRLAAAIACLSLGLSGTGARLAASSSVLLETRFDVKTSVAIELDEILHFETNLDYQASPASTPVPVAFSIALREKTAPKTVANFLDYVESGAYIRSIFHRSLPNAVLQTGGFLPPESHGEPVRLIEVGSPVENEFKLPNIRGSIAMAKTAEGPDTATSQWFVNMADNSANFDQQNGGFTVFAHVLGNGMNQVDRLNVVPTYNFGGAFENLPIFGAVPTGSVPTPDQYLLIETITPLTEVELISVSNPDVADAFLNDFTRTLHLNTGDAPGHSDIRLRFTGNGKTHEETVRLHVIQFNLLGLPPGGVSDDDFWLGRFDASHFNRGNVGWIRHEEHDWLYVSGNGYKEGLWMWDEIQQDWLWTNIHEYPFFYSDERETWLYYARGGNPEERYFYDYREDKKDWFKVSPSSSAE